MNSEELGQVFTRRIIADYMVSFFTLPSKSLVLDPCFGDGVFLNSLSSNTDYLQIGYEIDPKLFASYKRQSKKNTLHNSDFLLSNINEKFDGIIMNPPYIRHEKIDDLAQYGLTKAKLFEQDIFSALPKSANLYMFFVVKAIDLLKPNGELIVIFPDSWLNSRSGGMFRNSLSKNCSVEKRIHVSGQAFEKKALVDVVILKLRKNSSLADCEPVYVSIDDNVISNRVVEHFNNMVRSTVPFHSYATIKRGLTTGFNDVFINPCIDSLSDDYFEEIISSPKSVKGYSTKNASFDKLLTIKAGMKITPPLSEYLRNRENEITKTQKPKTLANKIKKGDRWYLLRVSNYDGILFGYIVRNDMRFILNDSSKIARDNFYVIAPKIDKYVLLAILNSHYVSVQLESVGRKYGGGMLKLQKYDVESIVFPNLSEFSQQDISKLSALGHKLVKTGNQKIIDEITMLLSSYESADFTTVKSQLDYMRSIRLEGVK